MTFTTVPDIGKETAWKDAGWQGIFVKSVDSLNTASASFIGCTFTNSKGEGTLRGLDDNGVGDGQTINITVDNCKFENPVDVQNQFAAAIYYNNGYNLAGKGTISVSNTTFTDYNRGIIVGENQRDEIGITIDGCTFSTL